MEHEEEKRICQSCKKDFIIESEDFDFYKKIAVPPPTFCPECRLINRFLNITELTLYKDRCDKCGKDMVSLFSPETHFTVYCHECWWKDDWSGTDFGQEYDFSRPFFEQLHELRKIVPCQATNIKNSTDCSHCNGIERCKNCTSITSAIQSINCYYGQTILFSRDSMDSNFIINADHIYETVNSGNIYNTKFTYFSDECLDCSFIFYCIGCTSCFGCVNLRNQKYCIFNKQYSKEDYKEEMRKWDLGSYKIRKKAEKLFWELYFKTPRRFAMILNSTNVTGDDIQNTKNCKMCFSATHGVENCKFVFHGGLLLKDSYDVTLGGDTSELLYETTGSTQCQRTFFTRSSNNVMDVEYSENIFTGSNLFGCVKLRSKKYCILNKQYTKGEYEKMIPKIKKHMIDMPFIDKKGIVYKYGDFYPIEHAMWAYNESWAHKFLPISKERALEQSYLWRSPIERNYKVTIKPKNLPDNIKDVTDNILNEVIECEHNGTNCNQQCTMAFRIIPNELTLYRSMNLALPRLCPSCRNYNRLKQINTPKLWHRKCMCDLSNHKHEGICQNEFKTAIGPERKEIVYCEKCYQAEFI